MKYGLPYQGSKNTIAKWVVEHLPSAPVLVDLFAGGCAVTHAALVSGKFERVIANDLTDAPSVFMSFAECDDMALKLMYSFGNNCKSYLWSQELENVKVNASRMLSAPSMHERRMAYRAFLKSLRRYIEQTGALPDNAKHDGSLQSLESLERLQSLERLTVKKLDYRCVEIPEGACVYTDPPYRGTACGYYDGFDVSGFDAWLACVPFPVIVSEYTCPEGCIRIASTEKTVISAAATTSKVQEGLFIQKRFVDMYNAAMRKPTLFEVAE